MFKFLKRRRSSVKGKLFGSLALKVGEQRATQLLMLAAAIAGGSVIKKKRKRQLN